MSIFQYVSVKEVMGRVVRNTGRRLPGYYADDMVEWLSEGMKLLETQHQMIVNSTPNCDEVGGLWTNNHVVTLPMDLVYLIAVEDERGNRIRHESNVTNLRDPTTRFTRDDWIGARPTNFQMDVEQTQGVDPNQQPAQNPPGTSVPWTGKDLVAREYPTIAWSYQIKGNKLQTSEEHMFVKLHYGALLTDEDGYMQVPDVEEYKQALYWYVMMMLIGAGYKHHLWVGPPGFNFLQAQWRTWSGKALGAVKYPSQDEMESLRTAFAERMIPPRHFYMDFFTGAQSTQEVLNI